MDKIAIPSGKPTETDSQKPKEKIIFEAQPLVLPTILTFDNLTMLAFIVVILVAGMIFRFGLSEFLVIGAVYMLLAFPSLRQIFSAGSTSYVLTNQRVIIFSVGLKSKEQSIPLEQIMDIKVKTSGLQRVYGGGDILIYPKGLRRAYKLFGIKDPKQRMEQILAAKKKKLETR